MTKVNALVLHGYGINCEREMALACKLAGANVERAHAHDFFSGNVDLSGTHLLVFPGGFSFGDALGAGKVFANRIKAVHTLRQRLHDFVDQGHCILGVCNGFQILVKLGLLAHGEKGPVAGLAPNASSRYENRWVTHAIPESKCVFTTGIQSVRLPIRHAEGRLVFRSDEDRKQLFASRQVALQYADGDGRVTEQYPDNPNGTEDGIAGICDSTGRVLGMMAHPEAALYAFNHPQWTRQQTKKPDGVGEGRQLFTNAINYLETHI